MTVLFVCVALGSSHEHTSVDLLIIFGQSNAGIGTTRVSDLDIGYRDSYKQVYIFSPKNKEWQQYSPGVNSQYVGNAFGPELMFSRLWTQRKRRTLYVLKMAIGNTYLAENKSRPFWSAAYKNQLFDKFKSMYTTSVSLLRANGTTPVVTAIVFFQGEADATSFKAASTYEVNLSNLISEVNRMVSSKQVPWFFSLLRTKYSSPKPKASRPFANKVREAIRRVAQTNRYRYFDLNNYPSSDGTHLNNEGTLMIGRDIFLSLVESH